MRVRRDLNGIPVLGERDLEELAEHFLRVTAPAVLQRASFTPLLDISTKLKEEGHCSLRLDLDLGMTAAGYKILGYYDPRDRVIAVDQSLIHDDPRFPFTLAHELGHFYLHSKVKPEALALGPGGRIQDSTRDLVAHRIDSTSPRSLMEWQANHFAAGILVPKQTLRTALLDVQRAIGVSRNLGMIWHDPNQRSSRSDFGRTIDLLSQLYRTSRAVVRFRLYDLRLVNEVVRGRGPTPLSALMTNALEELFPES